MQPAELIKRVSDPSTLREADVAELQELVKDFPYFQSAQVLLCMASRRWDVSTYPQQLKKTAIICINRTRLYELIGQVEAQMSRLTVQTLEAEKKQVPKLLDTSVEEELKILDAAASYSGEQSGEKREALIQADQEKEAGELMELEILKQAVVAVVDKEIIRADEQKKNLSGESAEIGSRKSPETFSEWLQQLRSAEELTQPEPSETSGRKEQGITKSVSANPETAQKTAEEQSSERKRKQQAIIDKIIEKSPGAIRPREEQKFYTPERKAKESLLENEHLVTETLAKIYAMQGNVAKAIRSYEILSLKYPQKSAYFASLIQKLKQNQ